MSDNRCRECSACKIESRGTSGAHLGTTTNTRENGARLCAEHQPQRHGEATRFGIIQRLRASALAAAGPSDTAAVRCWFQDVLCSRKGVFMKIIHRGLG